MSISKSVQDKTVRFYAFIRGCDEENQCVVMALSEEQANEKADSQGVYSALADCRVFQTNKEATRWLKVKSIKLQLAHVNDQLSRSHRAQPSTVKHLEDDKTRLEELMEELSFVDWQEETWDDLDWDESGADVWL